MGVGAECDGDVGVADALGQDLDGDAGGEGRSGVRVSEIMQSNDRETVDLGESLEML